MSLQSIANQINSEISSNGQFILDDNLLGSDGGFSAMVVASLRRSAGNLIFTAHQTVQPVGNVLTIAAGVPVVPADSFLNLLDNAATVVITEVNGVAQVQINVQLTTRVSGGTLPWVFSQSFPELIGWAFDLLPLSSQQFIIVYAPVQLPQGYEAGLNFSAPFTLTNILTPVQQFLTLYGYTAEQQPLAGVLAPSAAGVKFNLKGTLGIPAIDMTALVINEPYIRAYMDYGRPQGTSVDYEPMGEIAIGALTSLLNSDNVSVNLDVYFQLLPYPNLDTLSLYIIPADATSTSLANIGNWMAGQSWDEFFRDGDAAELLTLLNTFGLRSYSMTFSLTSVNVLSTSLTVGTLEPWVVPFGNMVMPTFYVTWMLVDPFDAFINTISLFGELDMFGSVEGQKLIFTGALLLPQLQLSLSLASPNPMTAGEWLNTIVTAFGGTPVDQYIIDALEPFSIDTITFWTDVTQEVLSYTMSGSLLLGAPGSDAPQVDFNVHIELMLQPRVVYEIKASFYLAGNLFSGKITNQDSKTVLALTWSDPTNPVTINNIADSLGYPDLGIPPALDLNLQGFGLVYDFTDYIFTIGADSSNYGKADLVLFKPAASSSYVLFAGLNVDHTIDLTNLPLVGQALSMLETVAINNLQVLISSQVLTPADSAVIAQVNQLISMMGSGYTQIPAEGMASSVSISMQLSLGSYIIPIGVGTGGASSSNMPPEKSSVQGTPSGDAAAAVPSTPGNASDGITWFNVQKTIGPLTFRRIGIKYEESVLWFSLDATFSAGGLTLDLLGMSIGSPLNTFEPHFTLQGIGVDFNEPGLEIGGALLHVTPAPGSGIEWEYAGGAVLKVATFSLAAYGDYASVSGTPSLFLFGQVSATFGGPPAFFVTGLAAGFGYNSSLRIPAYNEVYNFPLLTIAQSGSATPPMQVLNTLLGTGGQPAWITHDPGQYWLAAGIQFTTYGVVSTNAMLIGEFGKHLQFALLGLSRARFPQTGSVTYAFIELQVQTLYDVTNGVFSLSAILSSNSYLFDPSCRLMGGFAFFMWFSPNAHAGDFVITIGGYHPGFDPPPWYPQVPKVGFSWSLDATVSITGTSYMAITPSAIMAGGELSVTYQDGDLRAWFRAWANTLLYFNPFHFDIEIGIAVGASYRMDLWLTTTTLEVEMGATLNLWGPATGGTVTVHWWVISFTISFGADKTTNPGPLNWPEFRDALLPAGDLIKIIAVDGLQPGMQSDTSSGTPWNIGKGRLTFTTISSVPNSSLEVQGASAALNAAAAVTLINIRPMQEQGITSVQSLSMTRDGQPVNLEAEGWTLTPVTQNVGKALWGTGPQQQMDKGDEQLVPNQLVGWNVEAPLPELGSSPGEINVGGSLDVDVLQPEGALPLVPGTSPHGFIAVTSPNTISLIGSQIATTTAEGQRTALFNQLVNLGVNPITNGSMQLFADNADSLFALEPLLIPVS